MSDDEMPSADKIVAAIKVRREAGEKLDANDVLHDYGPSGIEALRETATSWFPAITVAEGEIAAVVDHAELALLMSRYPIFERGGVLVEPIKQVLRAGDGRATEATLLRPLRTEKLTYVLNKVAEFKRFNKRTKSLVPIDPPYAVAATLLQKGEWRFSRVTGVITAPTLRPDGTILDKPGYDNATQLFYAPDINFKLPPIKDKPTRADAEEALDILRGLLTGFPFEAPIDRAVGLSAMLTTNLRGAFDVAPMILVVAHTAGTGKSYLVDVCATLATGRRCPVITSCTSTEEMEKRLGALVLEGAPVISLDNCSHDLSGDLLCQIAERPLVRIRILGKSEAPECEWRGTLFGTGNNIRLTGDMTRRGLICNLDAKCERPERRPFDFDPIVRLQEDRGRYVAAALTIARAWRLSGEADSCEPIGSYGGWSKTIRAPLLWLGEEDPLNSMEAAQDDDPGRQATRALLAVWRQKLKLDVAYTTADLIRAASQEQNAELCELLLAQCGTPRGGIEPRKVGNWLRDINGQIHDGHRIELARKSSSHGNSYRVVLAKKTQEEFRGF